MTTLIKLYFLLNEASLEKQDLPIVTTPDYINQLSTVFVIKISQTYFVLCNKTLQLEQV
jgi:hypothetical protein